MTAALRARRWRARLSPTALSLALALAVTQAWRPAAADPHARPAAPVAIRPEVLLRSGEHPGFSRLVFDLPAAVADEIVPLADGLQIRVPGAVLVQAGGRIRGLRDLVVDGDQARLTWAPGTAVRHWHLPGRLVIDVLHAALAAPRAVRAITPHPAPSRHPDPLPARLPDAEPSSPPQAAHGVAAAVSLPVSPAVETSQPPTAAPQAPRTPDRPVPETPAANVASAAASARRAGTQGSPAGVATVPPRSAPNAGEPLALAAAPISGSGGAAAILPFDRGTGAAAFRRGNWSYVVFDEARPVDLAPLRGQAAFAGVELRLLPAATALRVRLGPGQALALAPRLQAGQFGWSVTVAAADAPLQAIRPVAQAGRLDLPMSRPGRVVAMPDPDTGGLLLVGTQARDPASMATATSAAAIPQGIAVERRAPGFDLLASWQGIAVDPIEDSLVLRAAPGGFVLEGEAPGPALALQASALPAPPSADAGRYSRRFDLPADTVQALVRRLQAATSMAAAQPPQDRGPARLAAAQAMLALGMGAEANALVHLATTDDPRLARDPQAIALGSAAALLAGRATEAAGLDDPALSAPGQPGLDETMLWQALLAARTAELQRRADPAAAQRLAAMLPLLQAYPAMLRERLLPLALRTMVLGGEAAAARRAVDAQPDDTRLDYARALLDEQEGHAPDALARFDHLAQGHDADVAARAAVRAVESRLESHALTPLQAADALDPLLYAWRGDRRELAVRLREAALRLQAGQPRAGLALLREATDPVLSQGWPDQLSALHQRMVAGFSAALAGASAPALSPLDFVAMIQENLGLLPGGAAGEALAEQVADRLAALDLPDQAAVVLGQLVGQVPAGAARAALGGRLAALQLEQHDPEAALRSLSASTSEALPAALVERRTLVYARATAMRGDLPAAVGALEALGTPGADSLRASLLEAAAQWPQAVAALQRVVDRTLPGSGSLDESQTALLLRLASAAAQAGDVATLAGLRSQELARVAPGRSADLLRVLTEGPVQTVADLPRAGADLALARTALK